MEHVKSSIVKFRDYLKWYYKYVMLYEVEISPIIPYFDIIKSISKESIIGVDEMTLINMLNNNDELSVNFIRDYKNELTELACICTSKKASFTIAMYYKVIWNINLLKESLTPCTNHSLQDS